MEALTGARLAEVQKFRARGEALPLRLLPTRPDILAVLTGSDTAVAYLVEVLWSLWEQNQRLAQEIEDIKRTLFQNNIYGPIKLREVPTQERKS